MNVLVVTAHPQSGSFTQAVSAAAERGLTRGGHHVTTLDLYALGFVPAMSAAERAAYHGDQPLLDPMVTEHARLVQDTHMLVFVYPTWWSGPPAILRGWLERVMVPGVSFRFDDKGKVRPALTNVRRIVGITTYGAPWTYVKLLQDGGRRMLTRALRLSCGARTPTTWLGLYSMDTQGDSERRAFLDRVEHRMAHLSPGHR
ncbi:MAG: NAD(P)H-dependent oxidoreductase [Ilumatobacteraceae bacterium]